MPAEPSSLTHPAPVGVLAVPRALASWLSRHLAGAGRGLGVAGRADDPDADDLGGALGVAGHLLGQVGARGRRAPSAARPRRRRRPARWPARSRCRWSRCSRRRTCVLKESATACCSSGREPTGLDLGVGGEHGEHRGHVRRQHRGALGHAADDEAVTPRRATSLRMGVGREDGPGCVRAAVDAPGAGETLGMPPRSASIGQRDADQAGGADQDLVGPAAELRGDRRAHALRGVPAGLARWPRWRCRC